MNVEGLGRPVLLSICQSGVESEVYVMCIVVAGGGMWVGGR